MTAQETSVVNGVATTLAASMGMSATSFVVTSRSGFPAVPFYVVIDPEDVARREFMLVDGSIVGTSLFMSAIGKRYLAGSAATSGLTHDSGAAVWVSPVAAQLFEDLHDRVDLSYRPGGTDVPISDGGTGASTVAAAQANLQLTPGTYTAAKTALDAEVTRAEAAEASTASTAAGLVTAEGVTRAAADTALSGRVTTIEAGYARGQLANGYAEATSDQLAVGTGATDLTGLTVTVTVPASRRIRISGFVAMTVAATATNGNAFLMEGATQLQQAGALVNGAGFSDCAPVRVLTPSAGSHTYKLQAAANGGTINVKAGSDHPNFILVEDLGPA